MTLLRVLEYMRHHPEARNTEVGAVFDIDGGRVSEIFSGERDHILTDSQRIVAQRMREEVRQAWGMG